MTIRELAAMLNVSRGTVDRVLHNRGRVNPETKERVLNALDKYGYLPNQRGKALAAMKKTYQVGILFFTGKDDFNSIIVGGIKQALLELKDYKFQIHEITIKEETPKKACEGLQRLQEIGVDAVIFSPIDVAIVRKKVNELSQAGVAVVAVATDISGGSRFCFVGHNNFQSGQAAARMLSGLINNRGGVVIVSGSQEYESHHHRREGALDFFKNETPEIKILKIVEYEEEPSLMTENITRAFRENQPDAVLILSVCIDETFAALEAAELSKQVKLGAFDLNKKNTEYLRSGMLQFVIDQQPAAQGRKAMDLVAEYLIGDKTPDKDIYYTKTTIVIKENLPDYDD